jgi:hypothetical protein
LTLGSAATSGEYGDSGETRASVAWRPVDDCAANPAIAAAAVVDLMNSRRD